jgi:peptidoglycan/xylan/chitin deacetylase (PgdA/CDA1 family)
MLIRNVLGAVSPGGGKGRLSILIFHRVLPQVDPLFPQEMDAQRFHTLCTWLAGWFNVLPLDEAVRRLKDGSLPKRALAITFDDGYADNFEVAMPILKRHGLCATFFIATGFLDGGRMWNDTVIESVRLTKLNTLPVQQLGVPGLAEMAVRSVAEKQEAIARIIRAIKYLPVPQRLTLTQELAALAKVTPPTNLMMTGHQVRAMRRAGMQIGAHTVSHPILATLGDVEARDEIQRGKHHLEDLLDEPVTLFAYPNGKPGEDYSPQSVEIVKDLGFEAAVSTAWGASNAQTDHFQIPRFTPWDLNPWRFALRMMVNLKRTELRLP